MKARELLVYMGFFLVMMGCYILYVQGDVAYFALTIGGAAYLYAFSNRLYIDESINNKEVR